MFVTDIDSALFGKMLASGAANLSSHADIVNDLNVFPIPDGDTGSNMLLTINAGVAGSDGAQEQPLDKAAMTASKGMLLGARGNSGVILSRIFSGLAKGLTGHDRADVKALSSAFSSAVAEAYNAVSQPVEGTILTVLKDGVTYANSACDASDTVNRYLDLFIEECKRSLERTPDLLDVLREAGVVDSGGAGLIYILEGMKDAADGRESSAVGAAAQTKSIDLNAFTEDSELTFGYCTEFLLRLQNSKTDLAHFDLDVLIDYLNTVGDSVVAFREDSIVKVHVHTKKPGDVFNYCQQYGEFLTSKMENMTLQHNETHGKSDFVPTSKKPHKPYGIVSVAAGKGVREAFVSLGCDEVVDGGQSMNPSAQDFIRAFQSIDADVIFVFPNNGNILMTATQAAQMYKDADVRVLPSKTIGDGYAAISMMDTSSGDTDRIIAELTEVINGVVTGMVSRAVRDSEQNGVAIEKDSFIGFADSTIYNCSQTRNEAALSLASELNAGRYDILLLVCGTDASPGEAQELYSKLQGAFRRTEIVMIDGGQPIYDYIIILE